MSAPVSIDSIIPEMPALFDRSDWGRIRLTGADRVRFLHNQTTNNIETLSPGQGCHTVFVTSTGRTIDLATVYLSEASLLVVVSPGMAKQLYEWMDRYIFFSDKVALKDETEETFLFTLLGDGADDVVKALGADAVVGQDAFTHQSVAIADVSGPVEVAVGSDLATPGYTFWGARDDADAVKTALTSAGASVGTAQQWERLRIQQGRPMPAAELTDDDNPLEAGLWQAISFEKGCYIGQETIARLNTYQGVKKRLWGIVLEKEVEPGTTIFCEGDKVGKLTSVMTTDEGAFGLGYVRTKAGGEGISVTLDDVKGEAIALPFVTHTYYAAGE